MNYSYHSVGVQSLATCPVFGVHYSMITLPDLIAVLYIDLYPFFADNLQLFALPPNSMPFTPSLLSLDFFL